MGPEFAGLAGTHDGLEIDSTTGGSAFGRQESELCLGKSFVQTFGLSSVDLIRLSSISATWRIESSRRSDEMLEFRHGELCERLNLSSANESSVYGLLGNARSKVSEFGEFISLVLILRNDYNINKQ